VASLQVLYNRRRFPLRQEVRQFRKHFLREIPDLFVGPSLCLGEGEDRRHLFSGQAAGGGAVTFTTCGIGVAIGMSVAGAIAMDRTVSVYVSVANVEVQVQSDAEQCGSFLQAVRGRGFQIVSERDHRVVLLCSGDSRLSKLALRDSLRRQLSEHDDFIVEDAVFLDLEDPLCVEAFVEPLNYGATFDVVEHISVRTLPSLDLLRRKWSFEYLSIHTRSSYVGLQFYGFKRLESLTSHNSWRVSIGIA
jgi:hypothetical protein